MARRKSGAKGGPSRRMVAIGLVGTGLYAGVVGAGAPADAADPAIVAGASPDPVVETTATTDPVPRLTAATEAAATLTAAGEQADPASPPAVSPDAAGPGTTPPPSQPSPVPVPDGSGDASPEPDDGSVRVAPNRAQGEGQRTRSKPVEQPNVSSDAGSLDQPRGDRGHKRPERVQKPNVVAERGQLEQDGERAHGRARRDPLRRSNVSVGSGRLEPKGTPHRRDVADPLPMGGPLTIGLGVFGAMPPAGRVPDVFLDSFRIPPVLLPIYQAAGIRYGVRWEVLAAINELETGYGRNLNVSSAGARGWMQFMPGTWKTYGVDANGDGVKDPYHPSDAIFAAARYLRAAGAAEDLPRAIYAYNHAGWYVDAVLMRARVIAALPEQVLLSLSWLGRGRLPVNDPDPAIRDDPVEDGVYISARAGARVVAVNDGKLVRIGRSARLGRYVELRDLAGNTYIFGHLRAPSRSSRRGGRLDRGSWVAAGTALGRVRGAAGGRSASISFAIRPSGRGAPRIDPKPILRGWKLRRTARIGLAGVEGRRAAARAASLGRILEMSKATLVARVLAEPRVDIYGCGRADVRAGAIDRRVLATLEYLAASGLSPTVSSLRCGHSMLTSSGNVSEHSTGTAVDIAAINGVPIFGHQGPGSITELVVQRLAALQGRMKPHQIITLMQFAGADNTLAMADHADHIHVGWRPRGGRGGGFTGGSTLDHRQWIELFDRLGKLERPLERQAGPR